MLDILMRAGCFVAIIILGYMLKKIGFFKQEDFTILSRITIRITLPAAIIVNFAGKQIDPAMLGLGLLGFGGGVIYMLKKPNISVRFGFHELFHVFVLLGSLFHFLMIFFYVA